MSSKLATLKKSAEPKFRQITSHLRTLINKGDIAPGTRLPTDKELAKLWGTNHFTVQKAMTPLVAEGLLERLRRSGTFVRDRSTHPASVAIYYGGNVWVPENAFYQALHVHIENLCVQSNRRCYHFVDMRDERDKGDALPSLQAAIDRGEIQGVIGIMISRQGGWLSRLNLPFSPLSAAGIQPSRIEAIELVLSRFAADGCKTVGMLCPRVTQDWYIVFKNIATRLGLKVDPHWPAGGDLLSDRSLEYSGYRLFKERWNPRSHPDGIFIYPDVTCRSATIAALELGVKVPRDVRFIFHRNRGLDYLCPWELPYLVVDVEEVARILMNYLDAQYRHEQLPYPTVSLQLLDS